MESRNFTEIEMKKEEIDNGRDEMVIDGSEQREGNAVPEGLNINYLKLYYGKRFGFCCWLYFSGSSTSYDCVSM